MDDMNLNTLVTLHDSTKIIQAKPQLFGNPHRRFARELQQALGMWDQLLHGFPSHCDTCRQTFFRIQSSCHRIELKAILHSSPPTS
mmetsp:Transcript_60302/g.95782  ORF Transcript_60302/g.95782 Transcript_60302/m.95782 type:complete len:86 (+) Transcript_60302:50-307(+)